MLRTDARTLINKKPTKRLWTPDRYVRLKDAIPFHGRNDEAEDTEDASQTLCDIAKEVVAVRWLWFGGR
jgi:hypothetical protein